MARKKFKFVEMFINPDTGAPFEDTGSPKLITPEHFPAFMGHQIAKIVYEEKKQKEITWKVKDGKAVKGEEKEITILIEKMGEKGGWIEQTTNLSQSGECWVKAGAIVCGNGYVCDDVVMSSGEVGENARVGGKAKISGSVGIGGNAHVYGKAEISGNGRIAVKGTARVAGKVQGSAVVEGSAYVGEKATVKGKAKVSGNARIIEGSVEGDAEVTDAATVYGTVKGKAKVSYEAIILKGGTVKDNAVVESGIIEGNVDGNVVISYGQVFVAEGGLLSDKTTAGGNAFIKGAVGQTSNVFGNGVVMEGGNLTDGGLNGNATVKGSSKDCEMSGGAFVVGSASSSEIKDGSRVGESGSVKGGEYSGSANVGGSSQTSMEGNSVVSPEATSTIGLYGNMVFKEKGDQEPKGTAVVCEVEP